MWNRKKNNNTDDNNNSEICIRLAIKTKHNINGSLGRSFPVK